MKLRIEHTCGEVEVLLKGPADSEEFLRIQALLQPDKRLWVWDESRNMVSLSPNEVVWCEVVEQKVFVYTQTTIYETALGLAELETRWEKVGFFRCAKSAVVNLNAIRKLRTCGNGKIEVTLTSGEKLQVSRHYAPLLRERLQ